jgi:hypothetical protein
MPPSWLLSPTSLFSRSSSSSSLPTLLSPSLGLRSPSHSEVETLLTPFEQDYGVPDLPGGWPWFEIDEAALRQRLVEAVKDGHATLISETSSLSSSTPCKAGADGVNRSSDRDIRVTKLVVHPIKASLGRGIKVA